MRPERRSWSSLWFICQKCSQAFLGDQVFLNHKLKCRAGKSEHTEVGNKDEKVLPTDRRHRSLSPFNLSRSALHVPLPLDSRRGGRKQKFECGHCHRTFMENSQLQQHLILHDDVSLNISRPPECVFKPPKDSKLRADENALHRCQYCTQYFIRLSSLQSHEYSHHSVGQHEHCHLGDWKHEGDSSHSGDEDERKPVCKFLNWFPSSQREEQRGSSTQNRKLACSDESLFGCKSYAALFKNPRDLNDHVGIHTQEKLEKCSMEPSTYARRDGLNFRKRTRKMEKSFKCTICHKMFHYPSSVRIHERIHTGERPFKCAFCSKAFIISTHLRDHERLHTGEKPFNCTLCNASFIQSSGLRVHHRRKHTVEKPFKCNMCKKEFYDSSGLKSHERLHTGEKPIKCNVCNKTFADHSGLRIHKKTQVGASTFKCKFCDKQFSSASNLRIHERLHTGGNPLQCNVCSKTFSNPSNLTRHQKLHTKEKL